MMSDGEYFPAWYSSRTSGGGDWASFDLPPTKSKKKYEYTYNRFMDYRNKQKKKDSFSENVIMA